MTRSLADLTALKSELTNDPNGLGLTLLPEDDAANSVKLNEVLDAQQVERNAIPVNEIAQQVDRTEYNGLSLADRQWLDLIMQTGSVNVSATGQVKQGLLQLFGPTTETRAGMASLLTEAVNRIEQLYRQGILEQGGYVTPSDVSQARQVA